ncbi:hypothetical protein GY45DRAFT_1263613, partial [Cubamyces sp. BRFM 1775]
MARAVKTARRYNLSAEARRLDSFLQEQLPIWAHLGLVEKGTRVNSPAAKCLRDKHHLRSVGECVRIARRLMYRIHGGDDHYPTVSCHCMDCCHDRNSLGCSHPHKCAAMAAAMLHNLAPKWNPRTPTVDDGLSLTPRRKAQNVDAVAAGMNVLFDPSVTARLPVANLLRVF